MSLSRLVFFLAFLLLLPGLVAGATPSLELSPCELPGLTQPARCGTYEVFENRAAKSGRKIPLRVAVLPATSGKALPDPIFWFAGGPGGSAVEAAAFMTYLLGELRADHDIVLVDVRGTGESNPLDCDYQGSQRGIREALESFLPVDLLPECRRELEAKSDLTQYNTPNMIDDVDEVRAALGYETINVMGGSYGSTSALVYLRRHPASVRTVMIEGVAPPGTKAPLTFARDAQQAFDGLVRECAEDADCHARFPDPAADLKAVLARLMKDPVTVEVVDPKDHTKTQLELTKNAFVQTVRYMLYDPLEALQLPAYLRAAAQGDFAAIGQAAYTTAGLLLASLPDGLYLSVTCAEDVDEIDPTDIAPATVDTFLGDFRILQQRAACKHWPRSKLPPGFNDQVRSDKPVLIISGERDPVTPVRWGELAARTLPNSRLLVVPDAAHSHFGLKNTGCVTELIVGLVRSGSVEGLDVQGCAAEIERPPFLLSASAEPTIEMSADELRRFEGTYVAQEDLAVVVSFQDGGLHVRLGPEETTIEPTAPLRFKMAGSPPGDALVFHQEEGKIVGMDFIKGGSPVFSLRRADE